MQKNKNFEVMFTIFFICKQKQQSTLFIMKIKQLNYYKQ